MSKVIFSFDDKLVKKLKNKKNILGGKGANLGEMGVLGLPVPPGFTSKPLTSSLLSPVVDPPTYEISDPESTLNVSRVPLILLVAMFFKKFDLQSRAEIECLHLYHDLS